LAAPQIGPGQASKMDYATKISTVNSAISSLHNYSKIISFYKNQPEA